MKLTIWGSNTRHLEQIEHLAIDLGLSVVKSDNDLSIKNEPEGLLQLMKEKAASGGITSIHDPIKWQKEIRKDRRLYGRE